MMDYRELRKLKAQLIEKENKTEECKTDEADNGCRYHIRLHRGKRQ